MKFTESDLIQAENLAKIINRAKFNDIDGAEIIAFAQACGWLGSLIKQMRNPSVATPAPEAPASIKKPEAEKPKPKRGRPKKEDK